ncbi:MAG: hypothetical protein LBQ54_02195 [Planctomycetaceae bacterium]|jgi:hypothetical protein|nr:hypothetical protein [Planctomycetaceae bacterium]
MKRFLKENLFDIVVIAACFMILVFVTAYCHVFSQEITGLDTLQTGRLYTYNVSGEGLDQQSILVLGQEFDVEYANGSAFIVPQKTGVLYIVGTGLADGKVFSVSKSVIVRAGAEPEPLPPDIVPVPPEKTVEEKLAEVSRKAMSGVTSATKEREMAALRRAIDDTLTLFKTQDMTNEKTQTFFRESLRKKTLQELGAVSTASVSRWQDWDKTVSEFLKELPPENLRKYYEVIRDTFPAIAPSERRRTR